MSCVGETERDRERERGVLQSYGAGLIAASRLAACRCQRRCVKQFYCVQPAGESRSHKGFFVARRISALYSILFWCFAYKFCLRFTKIVSCPSNAVTVYLFIMSSVIFLVSMNLTGYVQCILCVDSLVDILVHQSGTFFVIWYFDCCIDCTVFFLVCLSV